MRLTKEALEALTLIGQAQEAKGSLYDKICFIDLPPVSKLRIGSTGFDAGLISLLSNGFVSQEIDQGGSRRLWLTHDGCVLYWASQMQGGLLQSYERVGLDTYTEVELKRDLEYVDFFAGNWAGEFVHVMAKWLPHDAYHNCIFLHYIASQTSVFDWICHSLVYGSYELVLRELRSILEGLFTAYKLDIQENGKPLSEKLLAMMHLESCGKGHGIAVFRSDSLRDWKRFYSVYKGLCGYVHTTREVAGQQIEQLARTGEELIDPAFSQSSFANCISAWRAIGDAAEVLANELLAVYGVDERFAPGFFDVINSVGRE